MKEIAVLIIAAVVSYWFFVLRPGRLNFWRLVAKHPDAAYDHFKADTCWKVFEDDLPKNYRTIVPKPAWRGPFRIVVPKLGSRTIRVFGKYPDFTQSQDDFFAKFTRRT